MLPATHDVMTSFAKSFRLEGISAPRPDNVIPTVVGFENPQSAYVAIVSAFFWGKIVLKYKFLLWLDHKIQQIRPQGIFYWTLVDLICKNVHYRYLVRLDVWPESLVAYKLIDYGF